MARWLPPTFKDGLDEDAVDGAIDFPYDTPNLHVEYVRAEPPGVQTCFWRSVGPGHNIFVIESFVDELAHAAGQDPVAFRRAHLAKEPRLLACLDLAAEKAGWGSALPARVGRGVACQSVFGSYVAAIVEAEVDANGEIAIRRVTAAVDCGTIVNPDSVEAQIQGGLIFGLTAALYNEITIANGRVQQSNFNNYRMMRINEAPAIEVHLDPERRGAGRHRRAGDFDRRAGARQRALRSDGGALSQPADRPQATRIWESRVRNVWRILLAAAGLVAVAVLGFVAWNVFGPGPTDFAGRDRVALADYKQADPTGAPASLKDASLIERGRYLIRAADCEACHTAIGGQPFAGGRGFVLPFGTMYSTNITPDKETGIGQYSDAEFLAAVHRGVRRDGAPLYPAMPFASYTYLTDADALAIKAYLFSLAPISAPAIPNTFAFPFNQRWAMGIWAMMFNADRRFEPHADRSAEWNRGAYLVEALAHCGECHTPRNLFQALDERRKFAGAVTGGWRAYNITGDPTSGVGDWTDEALAHYLATGHAEGRGTAAGPMGEAVDLSLIHLTSEDIAAMVAYLRTVPPIANPNLPAPRPPSAIAAREPGQRAAIRLANRSMREPARAVTDGRARARSPASRRSLARARSTIRPASMSRRSFCSAEGEGPAKRGWRCRPSATPIPTPRSRPPPTLSRPGSAPRVRA